MSTCKAGSSATCANWSSGSSSAGFVGNLFMMLSSGGLATLETATRFPVRLLESGPAAGALAAATFGAAAGHADLLSFDMGGTTAKFAVIDQGQPLIAHAFEVDRRYRFKKGSGLPIKTPVIEMIEIGAGGGSIARVNALGLLKVGPDSAGADPGPVCYGRGGTEPTVTDADLVLGYLDPAFFLGGGMALDLDRRARGDRSACRAAAGHDASSRPPGAFTRSSTRAWPAPRASTRWSAAKIRAACRCSRSAGPARYTAIGWRWRWAHRR